MDRTFSIRRKKLKDTALTLKEVFQTYPFLQQMDEVIAWNTDKNIAASLMQSIKQSIKQPCMFTISQLMAEFERVLGKQGLRQSVKRVG